MMMYKPGRLLWPSRFFCGGGLLGVDCFVIWGL